MTGTLYIVATPIGNLEDLSNRANKTLTEVNFIVAEDTRRTRRLLTHIGCKTKISSLHKFNEEKIVKRIIKNIKSGDNVALVCDAGTPLVSDPGYLLVCAAHENNISVSPVPGPSAAIAALSAAGLPTISFCFEGFLPPKRTARIKILEKLSIEDRTIIFFEAVHRIKESLQDIVQIFGSDRKAFIGRELTKLHEQCINKPLGQLLEKINSGVIPQKGEFVIVINGTTKKNQFSHEVDSLLKVLNKYLSAKDASRIASEISGIKRNILYEEILKLKK